MNNCIFIYLFIYCIIQVSQDTILYIRVHFYKSERYGPLNCSLCIQIIRLTLYCALYMIQGAILDIANEVTQDCLASGDVPFCKV